MVILSPLGACDDRDYEATSVDTLTAAIANVQFEPMTVDPGLTASLDNTEVSALWLRVAGRLCAMSKDDMVAMFDTTDAATYEEMLDGLGSTEEHLRAAYELV